MQSIKMKDREQNTSNRFTWTKQLTPMEAKTFTTAQILRNWIPFHTKPFVEPE